MHGSQGMEWWRMEGEWGRERVHLNDENLSYNREDTKILQQLMALLTATHRSLKILGQFILLLQQREVFVCFFFLLIYFFKLIFFLLQVCGCVMWSACGPTCVHTCLCSMHRPEVDSSVFLNSSSFSFWNRVSRCTWRWPVSTNLASQFAPGCAVSAGIAGDLHTYLLCAFWGPELWPWCLHSKCFIHWAISSASHQSLL